MRRLLGVIVVAGLVLASCGAQTASLAAETVHLNFLIPEGPGQDVAARAAVAVYQKEHPNVAVTIVPGSNANYYPKMLAAMQTTPDQPLFNMAYINAPTWPKGYTADMWLPLDTGRVPNALHVLKPYRRSQDKGVGVGIVLIGLLYNERFVKTPPTSWTDLWANPTFKHKVVLFDYLWEYNGLVMAARLNGGSESNVEPGIRVWSQHTDQIRALITSTDQMQNLLQTGDAWLTAWPKANQAVWAKQGLPFAFAIPKEGAVAFPLYLTVIKGSSPAQVRTAQDLINLLLSPYYQNLYAASSFTSPVTDDVRIPAALANDPAFSQRVLSHAILLDEAAIAANSATYTRLWNAEVKSKL
jgi:putative spermidine/putrescine transport system substrate-binding protein